MSVIDVLGREAEPQQRQLLQVARQARVLDLLAKAVEGEFAPELLAERRRQMLT